MWLINSVVYLIITGASYTSQLLNVTDTLQVLHLSGNAIGDDGMAEICEALNHNTQLMITELWVSRCGLSVKGSLTRMHIKLYPCSYNYIVLGKSLNLQCICINGVARLVPFCMKAYLLACWFIASYRSYAIPWLCMPLM